MKITSIILVSIILVSCGRKPEDEVLFEIAQPEGSSNGNGIPKKLIGQYLSLNDSSKLIITNELIIKYSIEELSDKLDSIEIKHVNGDTSFSITDGGMMFAVRVKGDSTFQRWSYFDTIFNTSEGDIIRKYKGRYFLNTQVEADRWRVTTLSRIDNGVILGTVSTKEEIDDLRALTDTKSDSVFAFRPTKKQLKKFLKENGFRDQDTYLKIE
jgi:hypothetical protein